MSSMRTRVGEVEEDRDRFELSGFPELSELSEPSGLSEKSEPYDRPDLPSDSSVISFLPSAFAVLSSSYISVRSLA